ncbi:DUF599 family protein [Marinobacter sp. S0848L]|uniref:DUF599 family protein n=1 Tax=Marinobacter sp. S0848L TaxID=2926423 RepID=UPI001FF1225F|nr:DUF599 family protein [Marinobacter sp. S0848L]MCK0106328.1 DUF599 family protein [Marinobacter sp. S0848L]
MTHYLDILALLWFLICWGGYTWYSKKRAQTHPCLSNSLDLYREDWMRVMLKRENRIADTSGVYCGFNSGGYRIVSPRIPF